MTTRYSPEIRARAVRLVMEHEADYPSERAAMQSIPSKIGCTAETLPRWVRREKRDGSQRAGPTTDQLARLKARCLALKSPQKRMATRAGM